MYQNMMNHRRKLGTRVTQAGREMVTESKTSKSNLSKLTGESGSSSSPRGGVGEQGRLSEARVANGAQDERNDHMERC